MQESQTKSQKLLKNIAVTLYVIAASSFLPIACFADTSAEIRSLIAFASVALCAFGISICVMVTGAFKPILPFLLITVFLFLSSPWATAASILPLLFISIALFAFLYESLDSHLVLLAAIPAYAIAFFAVGDYILALFSLLAIIAGTVLRFSHKGGAQRVGVICRLSLTIGASSLIILLCFAYLKGVSFAAEDIRAFFDALKESLIELFSDTLTIAAEQIASTSLTVADLLSLISTAVTAVFNLSPAITVILLFIVSYLVHSLYIAFVIPITEDKKTIQNAVTFKMSVTSAVLFIVAFIVWLILCEKSPMYAAAAQNIYVIFFPGLSLIAVGFILGLSKGPRASCLGFLFNLALFGMFFYIPYIAFPVASFIGAAVVIISALNARKKKDDNTDNI